MQQHIIIIPFRLPSLNEFIYQTNRNRFKGADLKKTVETQIIASLSAEMRQLRIKKAVNVDITYYEPNQKRDKDNISFGKKFILDALVRIGILKNDGWKYIKGFTEDFICTPELPGKVIVTLYEE